MVGVLSFCNSVYLLDSSGHGPYDSVVGLNMDALLSAGSRDRDGQGHFLIEGGGG